MRDQAGASRGFGFVNFEKPEAADKAVSDFNGAAHTQSTWLVRSRHHHLYSFSLIAHTFQGLR